MRVLQVVPKRKGAGNILLQYRNKVTSSNGEDGIIEYIAARMNVAPGYCVEFGAWDGRLGSNTWNLLNHRGWKGLLIEFNNHVPNDILFIQEADVSVNQGSSLPAMIELGRQKGYELVCAVGCNAFFVPREYYPLFGIENNHIDAMFDGTLVLAGKKSLNRHKIDFCDEDIQILPVSLRRYGRRLDVSSTT